MKKTTITLMLTMLALSMFFSVFVDVAEADGVILEAGPVFVVGDVSYSTNQTLRCERIEYNAFFLINNTGFNITTTAALNITLIRIDGNFSSAAKNDIVLDFYANGSGTVIFNISGMLPRGAYLVRRNGLDIANTTAGGDGVIYFINDQWSNMHFEILDNEGAGGNGGAPVVENDILIYVYDYDSKPVANALVSIYDGVDIIDSDFTDISGIFETVLDDGIYTVVVRAEDYDTLMDTFTVDGDGTFSFFLSVPDYSAFIVFGVIVVIVVALICVYYVYFHKKSRKSRSL